MLVLICGKTFPEQATNFNLRFFVFFCFAISTVFQAFFVSYLVAPKYEKKLETLDELLDSDVRLLYGYHSAVSNAQVTLSYPEFVKVFQHKELEEDCSDNRKCVERMIIKDSFLLLLLQCVLLMLLGSSGLWILGK
jgi:hypothetical protein